MTFIRMGADDALADIANFNLQILRGVMRAYVSTNAEIVDHNIEALNALYGEEAVELSAEKLEALTKLGLLVAPVSMPSFTTASRGAAVTYWRQTMEGKVELSIGAAFTGGAALSFGSETARQQSDSWGCEITWQPGDVKQFLEAFRTLKSADPQFQDKLSAFLSGRKEQGDG